MPLGSAPTSRLDIDFTRAQGVPSSGRIMFTPNRVRVGSTIVSSAPVVVDVVNGVASVNLVRLSTGSYRVYEFIDKKVFQFNMILPMSAGPVIRYETIANVLLVPDFFTTVRTVNGKGPDPVTGDIQLVVEGGVGIDAGYYTKPLLGIPAMDMTEYVQTALTKAGTAVQPATLDGVINMIPVNQDDLGLDQVDNTSDLNKPVSTATATFVYGRALPDRVLIISDKTKTVDAVNTYNMPNTDSVWAPFTDGPVEYQIAAAVGDHISIPYSILIAGAATSFVDLAVFTGPTPTRKRCLSSKTNSPTFQGASGNYPTDAAFQGRSGVLDFVVESDDLDDGLIRLRWIVKTSTSNGKMYANNNYPLNLTIRNTRLSGL